jgi:hypothetical protein
MTSPNPQTIPPGGTVNVLLQERLRAACRLGRQHGGHEPMNLPPLRKSGKRLTLVEMERQAILQAVDQHSGNYTKAARQLGCSRSKIFNHMAAMGLTKSSKIIRLAACAVLLAVVTGCIAPANGPTPSAVSAPVAPVVVQSFPALPTRSVSQAVIAPEPRGMAIDFAWNGVSGPATYRVYASTNQQDWRLVAETTSTSCRVTNLFLPQSFVCRAVAAGEESADSNRVVLLGLDTVVTITAEASPDLNDWKPYATIFTGTNPPGMSFFRTVATRTSQFKIE